MQKIIICSDSFKNVSGLSYIALNYALYFINKGYKVYYCIITGESCDKSNIEYQVINNSYNKRLREVEIVNCQNKLQGSSEFFDKNIYDIKPNIILSFHDIWQLENIAFSSYRHTYTWINYTFIESEFYSTYIVNPTQFNPSLRKSLAEIVEQADYNLSANVNGCKILTNLKGKNIDLLPPGIEDFNFNKNDLNRKTVFKNTIKEDDFLFMSVGANFQRKGLDYVVEAFFKYLLKFDKEERSKQKLYLHGYLDTIDAATDIKTMIFDLKLNDNIIMAKAEPISKFDLYKRYRCSNCYIGLPLAEGFGYGFIEAMINNIPIIYHNVGGLSEYLSDNIPISSVANFRPNNYHCSWKIPDTKEASEKMYELYLNYKQGKSINLNNREKASMFLWNKIFKQFEQYYDFKKIGNETLFNKLSIKRVF